MLTVQNLPPSQLTTESALTSNATQRPFQIIRIDQLPSLTDEVISFDFETTDLRPHVARVVGIAIATATGRGYYIPVRQSDSQVSTLARFADAIATARTAVAHNATYEHSILCGAGRLADRGTGVRPLDDTMIMARLLGREYIGLKWLAQNEFGLKPKEFTDVVSDGDIHKVNTLDLARYAMDDAFITLDLFLTLKGKLDPEEQELYRLEKELIPVISHIQRQGIGFDKDKLAEVYAESQLNEQVILSQIRAEVMRRTHIVDEPAPIKKDPDRVKPSWWIGNRRIGPPASTSYNKSFEWKFNPGSWQQVGAVLDIESTLETSLLDCEDDLAHQIVEYRHEKKFQTSYCEPISRCVGRMYGSFNGVGTDTGRFSASGYKDLDGTTFGVNLQTLPSRIKPILKARPGHVIVEVDYSQIELRVLAHISGDPTLIDAYANGRDVHNETMIRAGITDRRIAKIMNFNCAYNPYDGSAAYVIKQAALKDGIRLNRRRCRMLVAAFREAYPGVLDYYSFIKKHIRAAKFVSTLTGRAFRCYYTGVEKLDKPMYRKAVNHPIQGTAADMLKLALRELWLTKPDWVSIVNTVHDSVWFEVPQEKVTELMNWCKPIMENNPLKLAVPVLVEEKIIATDDTRVSC